MRSIDGSNGRSPSCHDQCGWENRIEERKIDEKKLQSVSKEIGYLTAEVDASSLAPKAGSSIEGCDYIGQKPN
ncbi:hypothetical protein [Exiguobacterium antarcticum]|uniref:hypothetical protein n=1 Tax=Exiguobacterium antarcticum TaxID=132920 RepID=UPI000B0D354B|nr:hypothetical protein [Exiguobacterium antarcticum]